MNFNDGDKLNLLWTLSEHPRKSLEDHGKGWWFVRGEPILAGCKHGRWLSKMEGTKGVIMKMIKLGMYCTSHYGKFGGASNSENVDSRRANLEMQLIQEMVTFRIHQRAQTRESLAGRIDNWTPDLVKSTSKRNNQSICAMADRRIAMKRDDHDP
jgi:hypothetical protein